MCGLRTSFCRRSDAHTRRKKRKCRSQKSEHVELQRASTPRLHLTDYVLRVMLLCDERAGIVAILLLKHCRKRLKFAKRHMSWNDVIVRDFWADGRWNPDWDRRQPLVFGLNGECTFILLVLTFEYTQTRPLQQQQSKYDTLRRPILVVKAGLCTSAYIPVKGGHDHTTPASPSPRDRQRRRKRR